MPLQRCLSATARLIGVSATTGALSLRAAAPLSRRLSTASSMTPPPIARPWAKDPLLDVPKDTHVRLGKMPLPSPSVVHSTPGFYADAAEAARGLLNASHHYHIFFNLKGFHNHLAHHVLAALAMGVPAQFFAVIYEHALAETLDPKFQLNRKPTAADSKPDLQPITEDNWTERLGRMEAYWPYLSFLNQHVEEHGIGPTLERFVFSEEANRPGVEMAGRWVGGLLHPLIHCGYGAEFDLGPVVAEGLAMAAITENYSSAMMPAGWDANFPREASATRAPDSSSLSLFSITTLMALDDRLAPGTATKHKGQNLRETVLGDAGKLILDEYAARFVISAHDVAAPDFAGRGGWNDKLNELAWFSTALLGATSRPGYKTKKHDFLLVHVLNSTMFLPALFAVLTPLSRARLLHVFTRAALMYWVAQGRPALHVAGTLNATSDHLPPSAPPKVQPEAKQMLNDVGGDPWGPLYDVASYHLDEHLVKAVRTLSWHSSRLRQVAAGSLKLDDEAQAALDAKARETGRPASELGAWRDLDQLDGSAFARTAVQLFESIGMQFEGDNNWSYGGPGFDEEWPESDRVTGN